MSTEKEKDEELVYGWSSWIIKKQLRDAKTDSFYDFGELWERNM